MSLLNDDYLRGLNEEREELRGELADLRERLARAEQRAEKYENEIAAVCPEDYSLAETFAAYVKREAKLADALRKYGQHSPNCLQQYGLSEVCCCGLGEALASAQPPQPGTPKGE